jgi:hypothetical protein
MWPLHIRTKEEYAREIEHRLEKHDKHELPGLLGQAFEDWKEDENFASWCAEVAWGIESPNAADLLARFMERYPLSLHSAQVAWAESLVMRGILDEGSNEARAYLKRVREGGMDELLRNEDLVRDATSRAFLLLTAVYTEAGARAYSARVMQHALMLPLEPFWIQRFQTEHYRLREESTTGAPAQLNRAWETFFRTGEGAQYLVDHCTKLKFPTLAQRIGALAFRFSERPEYRVDEHEMFEMLYRTDQGAMVLV